ncbi:SAG1386/EF1546 family surface-associated protein [Lactococcus kimchii]|uniref:SAG1386/EF1546 family surface-associated protein n=1 Tax=Lactococcus sp. S-13 TaxID=2507158 RepID=UPI001022B837|nr:SAG1386/EF1546 family surface-associated protein [Lactococcus sp. S-13]RZI48913.1 LysM peptidoglycan-binding domain-containing protein [Lactococcus sp. S-13]
MATKEPWNNEIYKAMKEDPEELKRQARARDTEKRPLTTRFLTFLVVLMFIIVGFAIAFILWNSQRQNNESIAKSFHQSSSTQTTAATSSTSTASSEATTESSSTPATQSSSSSTPSSSSAEASGTTYTITAGDYPSTIAAKTGIPWETIASLNNISADGYNADGSAIHAGQVLKLK